MRKKYVLTVSVCFAVQLLFGSTNRGDGGKLLGAIGGRRHGGEGHLAPNCGEMNGVAVGDLGSHVSHVFTWPPIQVHACPQQ